MAQIIGLPKLSPTMEEGVLVKWVKREGDRVEPGDLVAEVETDKANMDFNLEDEGVLLKLLVQEGDTVKLGAPVAILGDEGEDVSALVAQALAQMGSGAAPPAQAAQPAAAHAAPPRAAGEPTHAPPPRAAGEPMHAPPPPQGEGWGGGAPSASPAAAPPPIAPPGRATGGEAKFSAEPQPVNQPTDRTPVAPSAEGRRLLASPLAKSLAIELGVDLRTLTGSGPGGRIVERDVHAAARAAAATGAGAPAPQPSAGGASTVAVPRAMPGAAPGAEASVAVPSTALAILPPAGYPARLPTEQDYVDQPLSNVRKRIAQRLTEAKRDIPHFYLTRSFDVAPLLDFRQRLNQLLGDRGKVSVNDLVIKGVALALRRVPACNAAFLGDAIRYFTRVHIGVAVAIEEGLVTPVVRDADLKGIGVIAKEVRDLAARARDRRLKMHEIEGSTFTVSNLGMFDIDEFAAIINPPEAGLLAIGGIREEPVVVNGRIQVGQRMTITMSCDHRVIDGALGAQYMRELVELLERPEALAL